MAEHSEFGKVLRINLLVVAGSAILLGMLSLALDVSAVMLFVLVYLGQVLVNILIGFARLRTGGAAAYFLSALLVLIIGFGSCMGMVALLETQSSHP